MYQIDSWRQRVRRVGPGHHGCDGAAVAFVEGAGWPAMLGGRLGGAAHGRRRPAVRLASAGTLLRRQPASGSPWMCTNAITAVFPAVRLLSCYRLLASRGVACDIVASPLIRSGAEGRLKTGRRDARRVARLHHAGELPFVRPPSPMQQEPRDLAATTPASGLDRSAASGPGSCCLGTGGCTGEGRAEGLDSPATGVAVEPMLCHSTRRAAGGPLLRRKRALTTTASSSKTPDYGRALSPRARANTLSLRASPAFPGESTFDSRSPRSRAVGTRDSPTGRTGRPQKIRPCYRSGHESSCRRSTFSCTRSGGERLRIVLGWWLATRRSGTGSGSKACPNQPGICWSTLSGRSQGVRLA